MTVMLMMIMVTVMMVTFMKVTMILRYHLSRDTIWRYAPPSCMVYHAV